MEHGPTSETGEVALKPDSSRWCWECRRRRLVCDCTRPVCNKCKATGVVCPGYEDKKPLTWLAPGKVLSRTRKPKSRTASQRTIVKKMKDVSSSPDSDTSRSSQEVTLQTIAVLPRAHLRPDSCDLAEAAMYCKTGPLQLPLLSLWAHFEHEVFFRLTHRLSDNSALYPELVAHQLAPNPFVVPVLALHGLPVPMQHALVAMALGHRIYRSARPLTSTLDVCSSEPTRKAWWSRLHHHRGLAIHLMNEAIGKEDTRTTDQTIATVLVFLIGEVSHGDSSLFAFNLWLAR